MVFFTTMHSQEKKLMLLSLKNASIEAVKSIHFYISTSRDILCEEMRNARKAFLYTKVQRVCLEKALVQLFELPGSPSHFFPMGHIFI